MQTYDYVAGIIEKAKEAQKIAEKFTQEEVDLLTGCVAYELTKPHVAFECGEMLVQESGMGNPMDKQKKMLAKVKGVYYQMKSEKSVGLIEYNEKKGMEVYAKPMGVIGALIPVTNGEATPVIKALMALKTRNAIILAPHPKSKTTNLAITEIIRNVIEKLGYPKDLVQSIDPKKVSIEALTELMKQVDFVLATGGTPMVKEAYSSGTPTIGVGTGNVVSIIDETADIDKAVSMIVKSKAFDYSTSCSSENNIIIIESVYDQFVKAMEKQGGHLIKEGTEDKAKMLKCLWPQTPKNHVLNKDVIAKSTTKIAEIAGIQIPQETKVILVEENGGYGNKFPFTGEKLSSIASVIKADNFDDALDKLSEILNYQGKGHSAGIHTTQFERVRKMGEQVPVCRMCVNLPQALSNSGSWTNGLPATLTLGCGTWGNNSVSHNVTFKDLLNYTYVIREIPSFEPKDQELFDEIIRRKMS